MVKKTDSKKLFIKKWCLNHVGTAIQKILSNKRVDEKVLCNATIS